MPQLPSGTVTFLFTDVEGSTRRWEKDSPAMHAAVERHFALLDAAIEANHGVRFKSVGDATQAAFATALDALRAAVLGQRALRAEAWGELGSLQVRMALHTGSATPRDGDYLAAPLNRLARLISAGYGDQILLTEATRLLVHETLPADIQLKDLGEHRLRDLREAEHVFQVVTNDLPSTFPPLKSLDRQLHNLPVQLTAFVGREHELEEARRRLAQPDVRLLTLTGPGGTGKTRLALRVADELAADYPDGVWFVALAAVMNPSLVAATIAETLGLRETPGESVVDTLRAYLRPKRLLLVLDNFEHVVVAAPLVADLLASCPALQVLATSRGSLRITGEHELLVPPLALPDVERGVQLDEVLASEAVRLFVDRARAVRPDFALTDRNAGVVATICRLLDGLPLAIELAAARVRLLPPEAILARLDNRLGLLTGGGRDRPERQQTLRAAIAWSHDLLDPTEQALFRRLAVFVGGWTFEAAEAIANAPGPPSISVIDCLGALNDNSLIRVEEGGPDGLADPRFSMLQTVREFGLEQLATSSESDAVHEAHSAYFLDLAAEAEPHLTGADSVQWLDRLETDHDNVRAALDWLRGRDGLERAVRMAAAPWRFWWLRGHISEGRTELDATLSADGASSHTAEWATALDGAGVLAETQGDYARADELHEDALTLSRQLGNREGIARALGNLGVVAFDQGDGERATSLLEESLALARETGNRLLIATALNDLGSIAFAQSDFAQAESLFQESLGLRRKIGNRIDIARSLNNLGATAYGHGDFANARRLFAESLDLYRDSGDKWGMAGALISLAEVTRREGDVARAASLLEESLALFQETGDTKNTAVALLSLGDAARDRDELEQATAYYSEAVSRFASVDDRVGLFDSLVNLGRLLVTRDQFAAATPVLGAAAGLSAEAEAAGTKFEAAGFASAVARAREALGDAAFQTAWQAGQTGSIEAAVAAAAATAKQ
jgi:predicted ATPase/class 3 adenylate cyclase/Tfp pilus assembly protein PilF